ncbi:MAG: Glyoxalase-like domain [Armatimonadetes bacterium]|nr:Glyoxalase-like domain [Armatimonadota bacterium]
MQIQNVKFMLMVEDMDRAIAFYRDVIGLEPGFTSTFWSEMHYGDSIVALHGGGSGSMMDTGLGFQVTDVHVACREVVGGGGTIRQEPENRPGEPILLAQVMDPEGNCFMLSQYNG